MTTLNKISGILVLGILLYSIGNFVVFALANESLFDTVSGSVVWEGAYGDHNITKVGTFDFIVYNRQSYGASLSFIAFYIEKEGYFDGIWPAYTRTWWWSPDNYVMVYTKFHHRAMTENDIGEIEIEGWRIDTSDTTSNPVTLSLSSGGRYVSATITIEDLSGRSAYFPNPDNSLDNGWLYLGKGKGWKTSFWRWRWDDPWIMRGYAVISWDNQYVKYNVDQGGACCIDIFVWIKVEWTVDALPFPYKKSVWIGYWLGDNTEQPYNNDVEHPLYGTDGYIFILEGDYDVP